MSEQGTNKAPAPTTEQAGAEKCPSCRNGDLYACTCPFPTSRNCAAHAAPTAASLEKAFRTGWAACRDAEYVGQEAEDEAWGASEINGLAIDIEQAGTDCARCSGSGEDPEGYFDQSRGPDGGTHEGPCRVCGGSGAAPGGEAPAEEYRRMAELVQHARNNRSAKDYALMHTDLSEAAEIADKMLAAKSQEGAA